MSPAVHVTPVHVQTELNDPQDQSEGKFFEMAIIAQIALWDVVVGVLVGVEEGLNDKGLEVGLPDAGTDVGVPVVGTGTVMGTLVGLKEGLSVGATGVIMGVSVGVALVSQASMGPEFRSVTVLKQGS